MGLKGLRGGVMRWLLGNVGLSTLSLSTVSFSNGMEWNGISGFQG